MRALQRIGGAALCALISAKALAQAPAGASTSLEGVQVVAASLEDTLPEDLSKAGVRVDVLTDQAIRNGSYVDVAQALQQLAPGLYIQPKNGPFDYADISLQGSRTDDVLWLVDGVRINNRLYSGTPPLDTLPSSIVDRIEVLEGGQALFYGTAAVAGAVNIVTKAFSTTTDGAVTLAGDTNRGRHLDAYVRGALGRSQFVAYGSADKSDGFKAFRDRDYQPSATARRRAYDVLTLGGKYAYDFTDRLRLSASYQHTEADLDFALPYRVARDVNSRKEDLATVKLDYTATDRLSVYIKGYYHNWHTTYDTFYNDLAKPGLIDVLYKDAPWGYKDKGVNALGKFNVAKGVETYFGYDYQSYGGRDAVLVIDQHNENTHAVFSQLRLTPDLIPHARLAAGFRYNHPSVGEAATIWNVSGQYDFSDALFLRGEAGTNFRLPTAEELFANDPLDERGNPNLKPERSRSLNLSLGGRLGTGAHTVRWELIGFARNIEDLIGLDGYDAVTQQDLFGNVAGKVRVRGGEFILDAALSDDWSANLNYTSSRSRQDKGPQLARVPQQLAKATLDFHPSNIPFGATLAVNYTGAVGVNVAGARINYGHYAVVDLSGRYFLDRARRHKLNLSIQNLFYKDYGVPRRACADVRTDGPYDCSSPYVAVNRGLPRTVRASYSYSF